MDVFFVLKRPSYTKKPRKIEVLLLLHSGCRGFESLFAYSKGNASIGQKPKDRIKPKGNLGFFVFQFD